MSTTPSIIILLAAHNGERYIGEQIDSILNQRGVNLSIIISVDKCNDSTHTIASDYARRHASTITLLPYGKEYGSAGRNFTRLLCESDLRRHQYLSFSDQDDIWLPNKLERATKEMARCNAAAYSSNVTAFWESGKRALLKKSYDQVEFDYLFESPGPGCSFLLSHDLAELIQSHLRERLTKGETFWMHDWYCYSFARYHNFRWHIDPEPMMLYRQHELNVVGANYGWQSFFRRLKTILNGEGFQKVLSQASFIGQSHSLPIKLIRAKKRTAMIKLFLISWKCRRQLSHKIMLSIACLMFSIKGCKYNEND